MRTLTISLVQSDLHWEDKEKNLQLFEEIIEELPRESQVVVLPEMFSTGFSMKPELLAEAMEGNTVSWLRDMSRKHRKIITGSLIINEDGQFYNRLIWMLPDGQFYHYDKRHLFAYASEDQHYTAGEKRLVVQVNGWKICLQICYDLRFPVWSRQYSRKGDTGSEEYYDILIYVANWPEKRNLPWKVLLQARAIENQCYVAGVNRVGEDGHGIRHSGDSSLIDPLGNVIWQHTDTASVFTHTFHKEELQKIRTQFPFLNDADNFLLL